MRSNLVSFCHATFKFKLCLVKLRCVFENGESHKESQHINIAKSGFSRNSHLESNWTDLTFIKESRQSMALNVWDYQGYGKVHWRQWFHLDNRWWKKKIQHYKMKSKHALVRDKVQPSITRVFRGGLCEIKTSEILAVYYIIHCEL